MEYINIPLENYPRREHFEYFSAMADASVAVTKQIDITPWFERTKEKELPFFLSFLYEAGAAANSIPELRQRIKDGGIVEYDACMSSYTAALPDGTYVYCAVRTDLPFEEYLEKAEKARERALKETGLKEEGDPDGMFFVSCLPWLSYSSLQTPLPVPFTTVPRITWGKYFEENRVTEKNGGISLEKHVIIPVTIEVNHALADGLHIAGFFEELERRVSR